MSKSRKTKDSIHVKTAAIIAEVLIIDEADVTPDKNFQLDLGADSVDCIEIIMGVEDKFGFEITDDDFGSVDVVRDLEQLIARRAVA